MAGSSSPAYAPSLSRGTVPRPALNVTGFGLRGWRVFTIAAASAAALSVAFVAWTVLRVGGDQATIAVDDIGEAVAALAAAVSCGRFLAERLRTPIWCRRAMCSNSSAARERNIEHSVEKTADNRISIG